MIANASHLRSHKGRKPVAVSEAAAAAELNYSLSPSTTSSLSEAREPSNGVVA